MPAVRLCETVILQLLPLRVNYNSLTFFFELMVAKCFYLSRNLFPSFGYGKLNFLQMMIILVKKVSQRM